MSIPFWCVFISALLIYVARMPVAKAMKEQGGYDNHLPRQQQAQLTGFGARALAAHQNSFEAFILFAVGVLMAHTTQTAGWLIDCAGDHLRDHAGYLSGVLLEGSGLAAQSGLAGGINLFAVVDD